MSRPPLVVDASAAVFLISLETRPAGIDRYQLAAPHLLWSEALSAIRAAGWREAIPIEAGERALVRLEALPIEGYGGPEIRRRALEIATMRGWAKTYDAEYVAVAEHLDAPLLTVDERLRRGISGLVRTIDPSDLR